MTDKEFWNQIDQATSLEDQFAILMNRQHRYYGPTNNIGSWFIHGEMIK